MICSVTGKRTPISNKEGSSLVMRDTGLGFPLHPQLIWGQPCEDADSSLDKDWEQLSCCEKSLMD